MQDLSFQSVKTLEFSGEYDATAVESPTATFVTKKPVSDKDDKKKEKEKKKKEEEERKRREKEEKEREKERKKREKELAKEKAKGKDEDDAKDKDKLKNSEDRLDKMVLLSFLVQSLRQLIWFILLTSSYCRKDLIFK